MRLSYPASFETRNDSVDGSPLVGGGQGLSDLTVG